MEELQFTLDDYYQEKGLCTDAFYHHYKFKCVNGCEINYTSFSEPLAFAIEGKYSMEDLQELFINKSI